MLPNSLGFSSWNSQSLHPPSLCVYVYFLEQPDSWPCPFRLQLSFGICGATMPHALEHFPSAGLKDANLGQRCDRFYDSCAQGAILALN